MNKTFLSLILLPLIIFAVLYNVSGDTFKLIKFIGFIVNGLWIYYYIYLTFILVRNLNTTSSNQKTSKLILNLPFYLPSKLKKQILYLHDIEDLSLSKFYIQFYLTSAKYMFYLLLFYIVANYVVVDVFVKPLCFAYGAWFDRMQNPERALALKKDINSNIDSVKAQISDLQEQISSTVDSEMRRQLIEKCQGLTKDIKNMKGIHNKYFEKFENGSVSTDPEWSLSLYEKYKKEINEVFSKANNKADEISDILNNRDNFMDNNPIFEIIKNFKEYLASLSIMEICLVVNIFSCVFIITCIISILFAVFGNYLIDRFSLVQKFPKLSRIIQLRVKLQRYYIIINSVLIILALLSLILVNAITLING